ncbi:winged helix-turn-helix domain-containing protein [Burkholderia ubonensis]|uniref:winged helix-turn-helix domain-containing protein n=1 Tax=Burkholderia ubonensis TaxID=101571 RepID=UPI0009B3C0DA|nr:winged helix-turn-helix domain-containing protein [Burkholderia ubonensis]
MTLLHLGVTTHLTANEAELLSMLMRDIASKQAVIEQIWESKRIFVSEGSYHQLVHTLRSKLERLGLSRRIIKTLPRIGLKFVGKVEPVDEAPAVQPETTLNDLDDSRSVVLDGCHIIEVPSVPTEGSFSPRTSHRKLPALRWPRVTYAAVVATFALWTVIFSLQVVHDHTARSGTHDNSDVTSVQYRHDGEVQSATLLTADANLHRKRGDVYDIRPG